MCCEALALLIVPGSFQVVVGIAAAVVGTWLLRRRLKKRNAESAIPSMPGLNEAVQNRGLLNSHWKRNLAIVAAFAVVLCFVIFTVVANSEVSKLAFAAVENSPPVKLRLGTPIKRGFFMSGQISESGPSGQADIEIPISGPSGKATLYAVARKSAGVWKFNTLDVVFAGDARRMSLLNQNEGSVLPQPNR
jgi:hypothetical protein